MRKATWVYTEHELLFALLLVYHSGILDHLLMIHFFSHPYFVRLNSMLNIQRY